MKENIGVDNNCVSVECKIEALDEVIVKFHEEQAQFQEEQREQF